MQIKGPQASAPLVSTRPFGMQQGTVRLSPRGDPQDARIFLAAAEPTRNFWESLALRFGGFTATFKSLVEPMASPMNATVARIFFNEKLPVITSLAKRNPSAATRIIEEGVDASNRPWGLLLQTACGDSRAALSFLNEIDSARGIPISDALVDCAIAAGRVRPMEGGLILRRLFAQADTQPRLRILKAFVDDEVKCSNRVVGDLFVQIMARSTAAERNDEIYPALIEIFERGPRETSPKRGFLAALLAGWLSECPPDQARPELMATVQRLLV